MDRVLDKHPEVFDRIMDEIDLSKLVRSIRDEGSLIPIRPLMVNRVLNFFEAATLGDFTRAEIRIGVIAAVFISCVYNGNDPLSVGYPVSLNTFIPAHIKRLEDYGTRFKSLLRENEIDQVNTLVRQMCFRNPTRTTLKNGRIGIFLRDACLAWVTSGDKELEAFMVNSSHQRRETVGTLKHTEAWYMLSSSDTFLFTMREHQTPYVTMMFTQWGTIRAFNRNHKAALYRLFP